jgi:Domain of unknown function DUF29
MVVRSPNRLPVLYDRDETAWLEAMAELVRDRRFGELDYEHLGEYLADMARRDRREVESRLAVRISHLLKWEHQPRRRSRSWRATVEVQRQELVRLLESATLRSHARDVLERVYADGVRQAAAETGLPVGTFPSECPYTLDQLEKLDLLAE